MTAVLTFRSLAPRADLYPAGRHYKVRRCSAEGASSALAQDSGELGVLTLAAPSQVLWMVRLLDLPLFPILRCTYRLPERTHRPSRSGATRASATRSSRCSRRAPRVRLPSALFPFTRFDKARENSFRPRSRTDLCTASTAMFGVPKYSAALEKIRQERNVEGLFNHNLVAIDNARKVATFATGEGKTADREYDLLHVVPPQTAPDFVKASPLGASWRHSPARSRVQSSPSDVVLTRILAVALRSRRRRVGCRQPLDDPVDQVCQHLLAWRRVVDAQLEDGRGCLEPGARPR